MTQVKGMTMTSSLTDRAFQIASTTRPKCRVTRYALAVRAGLSVTALAIWDSMNVHERNQVAR